MGSYLGYGLVAMEMTAVTNKAVLCSLSRTRGELEAGVGGSEGSQKGKEGREKKEGEAGKERGRERKKMNFYQ